MFYSWEAISSKEQGIALARAKEKNITIETKGGKSYTGRLESYDNLDLVLRCDKYWATISRSDIKTFQSRE